MKRKVDENTDENVGVICKHLRGLEEIECLLLTAINELEKNSERLRIRKLKVAASIKKKSHNLFEQMVLEQLNSHMKKK